MALVVMALKNNPPNRRNPKSPNFVGLKAAAEAASRAKRSNTKKDTQHEVLLRKSLWGLGLRYRKHVASLPGNPDLVFPGSRVAVFCDGDFWHGRNWEQLREKLAQRHNAEYWLAKISRNRERDLEQTTLLSALGWLVLRLWETDIRKDPAAAAARIRDVVASRIRPGPPRPT